MFKKIEVGKPFPGPVPMTQGGTLDLWSDGGMTLMIQFPGCTAKERKAFKDGFCDYWFLEAAGIPVAYWIFGFGRPMPAIECNFDARLCNQGFVARFLDTSEGVKNALMLYLLDGQILQGIKMFGLRPESVAAFQDTVRKQLATAYSNEDYTRQLRGLEQFSVDELKAMALHFER